jgi:hypothetical protein
VKVVNQRTPCAVFIPKDADKTEQLGIRLGDEYELILPLVSQTAAPRFESVCDYITIEEGVAVRTAIGSSPAVRMKERYPLRIRSHGGSIMHAIHLALIRPSRFFSQSHRLTFFSAICIAATVIFCSLNES